MGHECTSAIWSTSAVCIILGGTYTISGPSQEFGHRRTANITRSLKIWNEHPSFFSLYYSIFFSYWGATYNLVAWSSGCAVTAFLWRRGLICIFFLMAVLHIITATTACFLQVSMIPSKQL